MALSEEERKRRISERGKAYYAANQERIKARSRAYRDAHLEERRSYERTYYLAHREERVAYQRARYPVDRPQQLAHVAAMRSRRRAIVADAKVGGCVDCGIKDVRVLDFDHVRGVKLFTIGNKNSLSEKRLRAEIAKCEVVCANCHRIRTAQRRETGVA